VANNQLLEDNWPIMTYYEIIQSQSEAKTNLLKRILLKGPCLVIEKEEDQEQRE